VGFPRDPAQWLALALSVLALLAARPLIRPAARPRLFVALCALSAAALSAVYVVVYLRGGPRIIDATSYWLEARALAEGFLSFPLHAPEPSVLGRFLVRSAHADGPHAAVIFPPGYPAVLALGFLAHAPLAVGPVLAAVIVVVTWDLATHLARSLPASPARASASAPSIPQLAVLFSVVCGALRYHTADTMSHGLSALCVAAALSLSFRALDARSLHPVRLGRADLLSAAAGFSAGWLFATRPISALALAVTLAFVLLRDDATRASPASALRLALPLLAGALPGVLLFLAHQHAATGAFGASSQRLYYATSDGPPGCFRYGFGAGIGCVGEHGDFVRARLADGYGFLAAAGTTLRRLKMHLVDPVNLEPLALLVPLGAWVARRGVRGRALGLAVVAQIAAYVPFYFDGNYPAGGARFFCDVLPVEHALAALAVVDLASRRRAPERWAAGALALALAGFAFRAGFDHAQLRDRDGGRPLFEPAELARAGVTRGLVFVDSDHGFDLAYDPAPPGDLAFARLRYDALDRLTWEAHGRPPAFRYRFVVPPAGGLASVSVEPMVFPPPAAPASLLIEGESLWPPLDQLGGWATADFAALPCASASRWLALHAAAADAPASITVGLPAPWLAGRFLSPRVAVGADTRGELALLADDVEIRRWTLASPGGAAVTCLDLPAAAVPARARRLALTLRRAGNAGAGVPSVLALDAVRAGEND
jgi:hypothetical protein